jgi:hypothetical protein
MPLHKFCLALALALTVSFVSFGQHQQSGLSAEDKKFIQHLLENRFYDESIIQLRDLRNLPFTLSAADSINYLLGVSFYYKKELDSSNQNLLRISGKNPDILEKAKILKAFNATHLRQYDTAAKSLSSYDFNDPLLGSFANMELAAISLLKKDTAGFSVLARNFGENKNYAVARAEKALMTHYVNLKSIKTKSPVLAAISSAIIPGSGKAYIGKTGQGISSFLICTVLGLQAWEAYSKASWRSPYFFLYSGLFGIFYTGNVYGSITAARNYNNEKYEAIRSQLLIDLHIPLRTVLEL